MDAILERLFARRRFGTMPGLETERELLDRLDHPERAFAGVHVAGTNGKGSVCAITGAILRAAGFTVGMFTSPHLVRLNERFRVNGQAVDDAGLMDLIRTVEPIADVLETETGLCPTFFECTTAMAFEHFRRSAVHVGVIETGMGGRLDATNTLPAAACAVTRIDRDHVAYLGSDIESIAAEKAGILKQGRPVVVGAMPAEASDVIRQRARDLGCPCVDATEMVTVTVRDTGLEGQKVHVATEAGDYGSLLFPLIGGHQVENLATAVALVDVLRDVVGLPIAADAVREGIERVTWPGRCDVVRRDPVLIVDGAHNAGAIAQLTATLKPLTPAGGWGFIVGMCDDKEAGECLPRLRGAATKLWTVPLTNTRGIPPGDLKADARAAGLEAQAAGLREALQAARAWAVASGGGVCVAGSLYLVGDVLGLFEEDREVWPDE